MEGRRGRENCCGEEGRESGRRTEEGKKLESERDSWVGLGGYARAGRDATSEKKQWFFGRNIFLPSVFSSFRLSSTSFRWA
jgi:hypothetical protein